MTLEHHAHVVRAEKHDDSLHVQLDSSRPRALASVTSAAVDAGLVPRETRLRDGSILLVLSDDIDALPADDPNSRRREVICF